MKWLTDITEFSIPAGKVYLSPMIDCFDGMLVSWKIGTSPDANMVNSMLDTAVLSLNEDEHPIVHSDRGSHYRWQGWINRMDKFLLTRSMSNIILHVRCLRRVVHLTIQRVKASLD